MRIFRKLFGSVKPQTADGVQAAIAQGDAGRDARDWGRAAAGYRAALALDPKLAGIWVQYAHALKEDGDLDGAVDAYRAAAERAPEDAETRVHLAHALKRLGREEEAIEVFVAALDLNPADRESADEIFTLRHRAITGQGGAADLDSLVEETTPGVSVVTCARNRTKNLLKALPSWLACPEVDEIIVVDWTSEDPVHGALDRAGLLDERVKVVRVEGERRWILSVAFNAGFRVATRDTILKADADIVLKDGFFARNTLSQGAFLAGNWRDAEPGQEFINGFFLIRRADLMKVGGFNEFITTYGWDDDDLYDRLEGAGVRRRGVDPSTISHLPHDDAARVGRETSSFADAGDELLSGTATKISANRIMCSLLPGWHAGMRRQPFVVRSKSEGLIVVRRSAPPPQVVPDKTRHDIECYATLQYLAGRFGVDVFDLDADALDALMRTASLEAVTATAVAVAGRRPDLLSPTGNYLIVSLGADIRDGRRALIGGLRALDAVARPAGFRLVVADPDDRLLAALIGEDEPIVCLSHVPPAAFVSVETVLKLGALNVQHGESREIRLTRAAAAALAAATRIVAPATAPRRDKLYIDAQHGLGNRLRAVGSAASIAEKTGRELVIVWSPDAHCECGFHDLFAYHGAVLETSFPHDARQNGLTLYNYMEVEEGSDRGAPIVLEPGVDAYLRSAYVFESPLSEWRRENDFLRSLTPSQAVTDLMAGVRAPNDVSVHIRMEVRAATEGGVYDAPENWPEADHEMIVKWRAESHFSNFMTRLDQMIEAGEAGTIFLAADLPETYAAFADKYGDRLAYLQRDVWDRSREQMHYALADAILLSRARIMLGSNWSSFSEIALRLSQSFDQIQLSGKDF